MTTLKYLQGVSVLKWIHVLKIAKLPDRRKAVLGMVATVGILFIILVYTHQKQVQAPVAVLTPSPAVLTVTPSLAVLAPSPAVLTPSPALEEVINQDQYETDLKLFRQFWRGQLPNASEIQSMSEIEMRHLYHSYLDNIEVLCRQTLRMGSLGDGGWEICDDHEFRPEQPCVVYSFGIANDFSFDDAISKIYGCNVYSFDPSINTKSYNRSSQVTFLDMGLGGVTHSHPASWVIKTLSDIRAMLGHADVAPDIVKIDIEGSEWFSLNHSLHHGGLQGVRQLMVEFHNMLQTPGDYERFMLTVLSGLQAAGFRRFLSHKNPVAPHYQDPLIPSWYRPCCYEVYFVNSNVTRHGLGSVSPL